MFYWQFVHCMIDITPCICYTMCQLFSTEEKYETYYLVLQFMLILVNTILYIIICQTVIIRCVRECVPDY